MISDKNLYTNVSPVPPHSVSQKHFEVFFEKYFLLKIVYFYSVNTTEQMTSPIESKYQEVIKDETGLDSMSPLGIFDNEQPEILREDQSPKITMTDADIARVSNNHEASLRKLLLKQRKLKKDTEANTLFQSPKITMTDADIARVADNKRRSIEKLKSLPRFPVNITQANTLFQSPKITMTDADIARVADNKRRSIEKLKSLPRFPVNQLHQQFKDERTFSSDDILKHMDLESRERLVNFREIELTRREKDCERFLNFRETELTRRGKDCDDKRIWYEERIKSMNILTRNLEYQITDRVSNLERKLNHSSL
jgi:hypothetical protein